MSAFAKIDRHQPGKESKQNVLAVRYENLPSEGFYPKSQLTTAVTLGELGVTNQVKTFKGKREKATIIYLARLPDNFVQEIVDGVTMANALHVYITRISLYTYSDSLVLSQCSLLQDMARRKQ